MTIKDELRLARIQIEIALRELEKKTDCPYTFSMGNISYDREGNFSVKLEATKRGGVSKSELEYNASKGWLGLPDFGSLFVHQGCTYEITGINRTGTKVIAKQKQNGKGYLFGVDFVKFLVSGDVKK